MVSVTKQSRVSKPRSRKLSGSVLSRVVPVQEVESGLTWSVYGLSGTGKTRFACTFPKPLLIIGAEQGTESVRDVDGVDFLSLEGSSSILSDINEVVDGWENEYKTVVLDTATSLQDLILREILGVKELPAQKSWGMASRDDWSQCSSLTKESLRALLNLSRNGCHVIINAQERNFNEENSDPTGLMIPYVSSALTPSSVGWLNPTANYICQTFKRPKTVTKKIKAAGKEKTVQAVTSEAEYCLRTGPHPIYVTKFRLPRGVSLPDCVVDPDFGKVWKLIRNGS